jgi:integrase
MLVLKQRHGSKNWTVRGSHLGVQVDRSTGTGDKKEAQLIAAKIQNEIFQKTGHHDSVSFKGIAFLEAVISYLDKGGESRFLEPLLKYFADLPIKKIDQAAIDQAALSLYPKGSSSTRNRQVVTPISAILKSSGLSLPIKRSRNPDGVIRWLTQDEASRLITSCSPHLKPLVMFMLLTGARAGEALWLQWRDVDLTRAHVSFLRTKNGESRGVPLHRDLVSELGNLPHREGYVFLRPDGEPYGRPRGDHDRSAGSKIKTAFQGAVRRAGIKNFRCHDLLHTFACWHYAEHRDLIALQQLGGWKTLSMVTRYAHVNSENFRDSINAMPSIGQA